MIMQLVTKSIFFRILKQPVRETIEKRMKYFQLKNNNEFIYLFVIVLIIIRIVIFRKNV